MRFDPTLKTCPNTQQPCAGKCQGYGTSANCPPLIVLAVLSCQTAAAFPAAGACR